jgi:hypothetical protein
MPYDRTCFGKSMPLTSSNGKGDLRLSQQLVAIAGKSFGRPIRPAPCHNLGQN